MKKILGEDAHIRVIVEKVESSTSRIPGAKPQDDLRRGQYLIMMDITALKETVYVPISIASGRHSTGFIYQIEGSAKSKATATVKVRGEGVTMVALGSIVYAKIPGGSTGFFKVVIEIIGNLNREYKAVISRINYKLNTNDPRYKRFVTEIATKSIHFK